MGGSCHKISYNIRTFQSGKHLVHILTCTSLEVIVTIENYQQNQTNLSLGTLSVLSINSVIVATWPLFAFSLMPPMLVNLTEAQGSVVPANVMLTSGKDCTNTY